MQEATGWLAIHLLRHQPTRQQIVRHFFKSGLLNRQHGSPTIHYSSHLQVYPLLLVRQLRPPTVTISTDPVKGATYQADKPYLSSHVLERSAPTWPVSGARLRALRLQAPHEE